MHIQKKLLEEHGKQLVESNAIVKRNDYDTENKLLLKETKIYGKIATERKNEMKTLEKMKWRLWKIKLNVIN